MYSRIMTKLTVSRAVVISTAVLSAAFSQTSCFLIQNNLHPKPLPSSSTRTRSTFLAATSSVGKRMSINENFAGLEKVYSNPDVFVIRNFLSDKACQDLMEGAKQKTLEPSPVAYAGWTQDFKDLTELATKGPVTWLAIVGGWLQTKDDPDATQVSLVLHMVQNFVGLFVLAVILIGAFTKLRADSLQELRTSSSTTLDDMANPGTAEFVKRASVLFDGNESVEEASLFEAPTVIRYEAGQVLAPHYDANRSAETEDSNRGGQTLATLIVYLNNVQRGGLTRFGKLPAAAGSMPTATAGSDDDETKLTVQPKLGDALLFFPADANGNFDERTEHEGCPAVDEKWIARIWRHTNRVPPPFGLSDEALKTI